MNEQVQSVQIAFKFLVVKIAFDFIFLHKYGFYFL